LARSAIVVGATGLVGSRLVELLAADPAYDAVHMLVRNALQISDARLHQHIVDFAHLGGSTWPAASDIFCCLGTTISNAGSQQAFRTVDYTYPLAVAQRALDHGAQQFLFVSSMGADAHSPVFYSRVKGELESAIAALAFKAAVAFRPSLLAGKRAENRFGERMALAVLQPIRWLVPRKYRPVSDVAVARAMIAFAKRDLAGFHVVSSDEIQAFAPA
jgi:uncharacterized protein YbjT (DUF2867 family)